MVMGDDAGVAAVGVFIRGVVGGSGGEDEGRVGDVVRAFWGIDIGVEVCGDPGAGAKTAAGEGGYEGAVFDGAYEFAQGG